MHVFDLSGVKTGGPEKLLLATILKARFGGVLLNTRNIFYFITKLLKYSSRDAYISMGRLLQASFVLL